MKSKLERLKKRAWIVFSKWIRNRDKRCVTCIKGEAENAGHFWHNILDFDEININGQCVQCNHHKSGNLAIYSTYLIKKYGIKEFKALDLRHTKAYGALKPTEEYYQAIIDKYTM